MDVKAYISSGIIERYVFQEVSAQELQEVNCLAKIYPEIKNEIDSIQLSLEKMMIQGAVQPPAELKKEILLKIKNESQIQASTMKIVSDKKPATSTKVQFILKVGMAACILGIIGLGLFTFNQNNKIAQVEKELTEREKSLAEAQNEIQKAQDERNNSERTLAFIKNTDTKKINLAGTDAFPDMKAVVYWNSSEEKTFLEINNLPTPPTSKQYQLWAIVDGTPTDMGVIESVELAKLIPVKDIKNANAFAITLEPFGGSIEPTLDQMYVVGAV